MSSAARTLLITGFEPFGGETVNASWEAARRLEGWRCGEYTAVARLLPCAYDASVKKLIDDIEALQPAAILMTGQAARRATVCVERFAHNLDDAAAPDNDGDLRRALRISRAAPEWLEATSQASAIARAMKDAGIRARVSRNAGGFVCNHLYFRALEYLGGQTPAIPAVFLHLPATPEQTPAGGSAKGLTPAQAADALRAAAAAMIDLLEPSEAA
ncbi:MAG TPA: pyroglutamyl-peptidase I [Roseiarcus sp.]